MAEILKSTESGELTQRFIEFVMMQSQNAALFLGQIPNPQTGKGEVNLDLAKLFIDQLAMIRSKTNGNLTKDEETVLNNAISNLQMVFVEVSKESGGSPSETHLGTALTSKIPVDAPKISGAENASETPSDDDSKKRFSKSYGA